jgi:hypothetical protein
MEYVEIIAVCCEIQTKHTNALCAQNAVFLNGENGDIPPQSPCGLKRGTGAACLLARIVSSNPAGGMDFVCCEFCALSGKGPCGGPITRPEES